jgi:hypothetical protein
MLPPPEKFPGSGVYAVFYFGDHPLYTRFRSPDCSRPIYVGKAVPPGARKGSDEGGSMSASRSSSSKSLHARLKEHAESITATSDLKIADFRVRYLVVVPIWITMAERFLIENFSPPWNRCIEGFGNHDPGKGRHAGKVSWWDTLHPGRAWVDKLAIKREYSNAVRKLEAFKP